MSRGAKPGERRGGRAKGARNRVMLAARLRIAAEADPVGRFIEAARTGKMIVGTGDDARTLELDTDQYLSVLRELRRMTVPDAKSNPIALDLPEIKKPGDLVAALAKVCGAMASGSITVEDAAQVAGVLELKRRAVETEDLERRLAAIEAAQQTSGKAYP